MTKLVSSCDCDCDVCLRVRVDFRSLPLSSLGLWTSFETAIFRDFGWFGVGSEVSAGGRGFATRATVDATLVRFGRGIAARS